MEYQKLLGVAVGIAIICMCIRKLSADGALYVGLGFCVLVLRSCLSAASPVVGYISELPGTHGFSGSATVVVRACAVGLTTSFACEICRSCGETEIAKSAEIIGRSALILVSLPLIKKLCEAAAGM